MNRDVQLFVSSLGCDGLFRRLDSVVVVNEIPAEGRDRGAPLTRGATRFLLGQTLCVRYQVLSLLAVSEFDQLLRD